MDTEHTNIEQQRSLDKLNQQLIEGAPETLSPDVIVAARRACLACNRSLDVDFMYAHHENNGPCILYWSDCIPNPDDWCTGCQSVATVKVVLK